MTLDDYKSKITVTTCKFCTKSLTKQPITHYNHDDGWTVTGFERKQWLGIKCIKCWYEWSLDKLGVKR